MRLKAKLLLLFVFTSLLVILAIGGILYNRLWGEQLILIQESLSQQLWSLDFSLQSFLAEVEGDVNALAASDVVRYREDDQFTSFLDADETTFVYNYTEAEQRIIQVFSTHRLTHPYVSSVYMGRENGSFVRSHPRERPTQYDPRERPWYLLAKENPGQINRTEPYPSLTTNDINIGIVRALVDEQGQVYGVVGMDVTLTDLTGYILDYELHPAGVILVLDQSGLVLASQQHGLQGTQVQAYSPDLLPMLALEREPAPTLQIEGQERYVFYTRAADPNWYIVALVPAHEIRGQILGSVLQVIMGLAAGLALLSILTLSGVHRFIVHPIRTLTKETHIIAQTGDLERRIEIGSRDELGELADAYNNMIASLGRSQNSLRQTETALRESEQKYRELVEHANSIIMRWSSDGRITFLNEFGQRFFGYSTEEIIGQPVVGTIVPVVDSAGRALTQLMDQIRIDPIAFEQNVNENMRRNGERVWIAWTNRIAHDEQGRVTEILSVGTDITESRQASEAIRELNATLERRVAERTAELAEARDRAEAADRLKSAFLATMSHELRTPLNSIIGFTGILLQGLAGPLNPERNKQLGMVQNSARHLLALINDVLDISKIEAGQLLVASEPFDLSASITKVVGIIRPMAEKKGLALQVEPLPEIGPLTSDPRRVEQILLNILNNAIKFTEQGTVTLSSRLVSGAQANGSCIEIAAADTGIGIKPEDLDKLFQPFRQIDTGLARQHEGTGLGLAICRRLVELLGGEIHATSVWGQGSVFAFTLPLEGKNDHTSADPPHRGQ